MLQRVEFDTPSIPQRFPYPVARVDQAPFVPAPALHRATGMMPCLKSLMAALHARDASLLEHCSNVAETAFRIAFGASLPMDECEIVWTAGLLHDLGKIVLPDSILLGSAPLTAAERRTMEAHVGVGYQLLGCVSELRKPAEVARYHHERWDGTGYPRKLKGIEIPIGGRILAIADAFDAMTSGRSYRPQISMPAARQVLLSDAGTHFDPDLVRIFITGLSSDEAVAQTAGECR